MVRICPTLELWRLSVNPVYTDKLCLIKVVTGLVKRVSVDDLRCVILGVTNNSINGVLVRAGW